MYLSTRRRSLPINTMPAARAGYGLHAQDGTTARAFAHGVHRACFRDGRDIADVAVVRERAARHGVDRATLSEAPNSAARKERSKAECDAELAKGVFGSPCFIVDGELFLAADRLPRIERRLASGGY